MELIDLVSDLLYKHNCVIIPGFGGFVGNFKATEFNESRMLLSPARKKVAFNQSLQENDGLLINALMKRKAISYEQSEKEVAIFVRFLSDRLEKYRNYEFKNIGSFYLNKENLLVFVAYEGLNFFKKSYGLQDVKVRKIKADTKPQPESILHKTEPVARKEVKIVPLAPSEKKRRFHLPQIAASVAVLMLFGAVLWQLSRTSQRHVSHPKSPEKTISTDSPDQSASLLPNLKDENTVVQAQPEMTDVTDELIKRGELKGTGGETGTETGTVTGTGTVTEVVTPNGRNEPANTIKETRKSDGVDKPSKTLAHSNSEELYKKATAKETVYYIAVSRETKPEKRTEVINRLSSLQYSHFVILDDDGDEHVAVARFIGSANAKTYLGLVRRYDFPHAYILTKEE